MRFLACLALPSLLSMSLRAEIKTEVVTYKQGETVLEGFLAYDDAGAEKRPGVLVIHDWKGVGEQVKDAASRLARLGYVALAADIYGQGVRPKDGQEAGQQSGKYKRDRALLRARGLAGLEVLRKHPRVEAQRLAAMGYCFGGTAALELARSGAEVAGVVSFHGGLDSPSPEDGKKIKAKVLVLHGADDPHVSAADIAAFQEELRKGGVDWRMQYYGGAVHGFTNPTSGSDNTKGVAYNERADKRSWEEMKAFFAEVFAK